MPRDVIAEDEFEIVSLKAREAFSARWNDMLRVGQMRPEDKKVVYTIDGHKLTEDLSHFWWDGGCGMSQGWHELPRSNRDFFRSILKPA